jgi:cell division protein FtsB
MRFIYFLLIIILSYQSYVAVNGVNCFNSYTKSIVDLEIAKKNTQRLVQRNEMVEEDIINLSNNNYEVIEDLARSNLGMIKPDEKFYRVFGSSGDINEND